MHRLIIARYAEALDWVPGVPDDFEITIVNKGAPVTSSAVLARATVVARPNVGREGETYLSHIATAPTEKTGFYTVFAQGDPFEHSPDFLALLANTASWRDVQALAWRWKIARDIPPTAILQRETGDFLGASRVRPEIFSFCTWAPAGFDDPGAQWLNTTYRRLHDLPEGTNIAAHFLAMCGLQELAADAQAHRYGTFSYGAVFAVRSHLLGKLPQAALDRLRPAMSAHSVYGYVLERLWLHIFGAPFILPVDAASPVHPVTIQPDTQFFRPPDSAQARRRQRVAGLARRVGRLVAGR